MFLRENLRNGITSGWDDERDITFLPSPQDKDPGERWRWSEQWIPHGAWLMLDEAHATGIYGKGGRGLVAESGVSDQIEVQMGTLGKALGGASGGFISGRKEIVELLRRLQAFSSFCASSSRIAERTRM